MVKVVLRDQSSRDTLAATYFRISIAVSDSDRALLQHYLQTRALDFTRDLFHQRPEFLVEVREGSLKGVVKVLGRVVVAISVYGGFRDGVDRIVMEAQTFSERILTDLKHAGIPEEKFVRTERRLGTAGQLKRLLREVDELKTHGRDLSKAEYKEELQRIHDRLAKILQHLSSDDDAKKIQHEVECAIQASLPERLPFPTLPVQERVAVLPKWDKVTERKFISQKPSDKPKHPVDIPYRVEVHGAKLYLSPRKK